MILPKIHEFDPVIYPYKLYVAITDNISSLSNKFWHVEPGHMLDTVDYGNYGAISIKIVESRTNDFGVLVVFKSRKQMTIRTIAHEASHAAKFLFQHIGADIEPHEPFEYVVGWVADCIVKVKNNKNVKD